eukprot:TRINITY_DN7567_c0_g1_i1.p1 TRINITY_DN7567_c0_g1~~TRINITY_DN7567_c0_g1_i1.p1  ORF type:complete len:314 (+),score=113.51 TRINITY_DN7567_c0_g1_i1:66-1007(+)
MMMETKVENREVETKPTLNWPNKNELKDKTIDNLKFYHPELFPHLDILRRNLDVILEELKSARLTKIVKPEEENGSKLSGVWCEDKAMEEFYNKTKQEEGWLHWWSVNNDQPNQDWTIFGLYTHKGGYMDENCKKCPKTKQILTQIPGIRVAGFSRIQPKSGIDTHKGFTGRKYGSLAWHLGLIIPPNGDAWLTCGSDTHRWQKPGEVIVFDDTFPHSAWNSAESERIIFYIDFMIPKEVEEALREMETNSDEEEGKKGGGGRDEDDSDSSDFDEEFAKWMAAALVSQKRANEKNKSSSGGNNEGKKGGGENE